MNYPLNAPALQKVIDENLKWLRSQPRTLERDHIVMILEVPGITEWLAKTGQERWERERYSKRPRSSP